MLEINDINTYISDSYILQGISIKVPKGRVVTILGRNGVGKTTLIYSIIGIRPVRSGSILLEQKEIAFLPTHRIIRLGIGLVPQGRRVFPSLTVRENLEIPYRGLSNPSISWDLEKIFKTFPMLERRKNSRAGKLSGGEQQMLATCRALICRPKLLLMDEPCEGLAPIIVKDLTAVFKDLKRENLTILLVEQKLSFALEVSDYIYVMSKGKIVYHSTPGDLWKNDEVKARYLGV